MVIVYKFFFFIDSTK